MIQNNIKNAILFNISNYFTIFLLQNYSAKTIALSQFLNE